MAEHVLRLATGLGLSLAVAESCTGGLLASALTDVKGLSGCFERGFVVYSPPSKCDLLGVDPSLLESRGAVSREVAIAMAEGAVRRSKADIAVSVTGYADDGPEPGLVHLACARRDGPTVHREEHFGPIGRDRVRDEAVRVGLEMFAAALSTLR